MEKIEQVIELVAFIEKEVSALLDCQDVFKNVLVKLNTFKDSQALNTRFEGLDETEIEQIKASERAEEIIALQEEAAEAFRVRKVAQLVSEKVEIEVEPTEPVVEIEVEPTEPVVEIEVVKTEIVVEIEVVKTEIVVEIETPKKVVKKV